MNPGSCAREQARSTLAIGNSFGAKYPEPAVIARLPCMLKHTHGRPFGCLGMQARLLYFNGYANKK